MSVEALTWVLKHSASKGTTRCVLMAIADQAGSDGTNAWPSHATLARHANTSVASVKRSIAWLKEHGEVEVEVAMGGTTDCRWDRRPNRYTVLIHGGSKVNPRSDDEGSGVNRGSPANPGSPSAPRGVRNDPDGGSTLSYNPPLTHPDPPIAPTEVDAVEISLRSAVIEAWGADPDQVTPEADALIAKAVSRLETLDATVDDVRRAAKAFRERMPHMTLTPTALTKHWPNLVSSNPARVVPALSEPERFGISLGRSETDHLEAEDAIAGQFDDPPDRATAMDAWKRTRRQGVPA